MTLVCERRTESGDLESGDLESGEEIKIANLLDYFFSKIAKNISRIFQNMPTIVKKWTYFRGMYRS